jgi:hypothetical protein
MSDTLKRAAEIAKTDPARAYDIIEAHEAGRTASASSLEGMYLIWVENLGKVLRGPWHVRDFSHMDTFNGCFTLGLAGESYIFVEVALDNKTISILVNLTIDPDEGDVASDSATIPWSSDNGKVLSTLKGLTDKMLRIYESKNPG